MQSWKDKCLEIMYSKEGEDGSCRDLIGALVECSWDVIEQGGMKEIIPMFEELDVKRVGEFYMLPSFLRAFYVTSYLIPNWDAVIDSIHDELIARGQDAKRLLRGNMKKVWRPEDQLMEIGPRLKDRNIPS